MVRSAARHRQTTPQGGYLEDYAAPLFSHDRQRSAGYVDNAVEVGVNHRLESLRAQLLERGNIAVSCIIYDDIKASKLVRCDLHSRRSGVLIRDIERSGANLIAVLLHQFFQPAGIAGGCDKTMTDGENRFGDVPAQAAGASCDQPNARVHNVFPFLMLSADCGCSCSRNTQSITYLSELAPAHHYPLV